MKSQSTINKNRQLLLANEDHGRDSVFEDLVKNMLQELKSKHIGSKLESVPHGSLDAGTKTTRTYCDPVT